MDCGLLVLDVTVFWLLNVQGNMVYVYGAYKWSDSSSPPYLLTYEMEITIIPPFRTA